MTKVRTDAEARVAAEAARDLGRRAAEDGDAAAQQDTAASRPPRKPSGRDRVDADRILGQTRAEAAVSTKNCALACAPVPCAEQQARDELTWLHAASPTPDAPSPRSGPRGQAARPGRWQICPTGCVNGWLWCQAR